MMNINVKDNTFYLTDPDRVTGGFIRTHHLTYNNPLSLISSSLRSLEDIVVQGDVLS